MNGEDTDLARDGDGEGTTEIPRGSGSGAGVPRCE